MSETFGFDFKTKLGDNVKIEKKNRVTIYLSYYKDDFDKAYKLINYILKDNDVIIYYRSYTKFPNVDYKDINPFINQVNTSIILVTNDYLLSKDNDAYKNEYEYMVKNNLPFLPIFDDEINLKDYEDKFGPIQFLDLNQKDKTQISVDKKLKDFLGKYGANEKDYSIASKAFNASVFLSYRKKDRFLALKLIDDIHSHKECREVGIWYDEFLSGGEGFEDNIFKQISNSDAFFLLVTPNLVNETNYVKTTEYPYAHDKAKKLIVPIEGIPTDYKELSRQYDEIPDVVLEQFAYKEVAKLNKEESIDPDKLYALGVAYLYGINVEINRKIGVEYLEKAADKGYIPALNRLMSIYSTGNGVVKDLEKANDYTERLMKLSKDKMDYSCFEENAYFYFSYQLENISILQSLSFENDSTFEHLHDCLKELNLFKSVKEGYQYYYSLSKIKLFNSLLLSNGGSCRELVDTNEYLENLKIVVENTTQNVSFYFLTYFLSLKLFENDLTETSEELINELFEHVDELYKDYPEMLCTILNNVFNTIRNCKKFDGKQQLYIFQKFLTYFDYYKDETVKLNKSAELIVDTFDLGIEVEPHNKGYYYNELKTLLSVYKRRSKNDSLLMGLYYRLSLHADTKKDAQIYLIKAKSELDHLPEAVFNVESRKEIRDYILLYSVLDDETISFDDKLEALDKQYEQIKKEKAYKRALSILKGSLFGLSSYAGYKDKVNKYYQEIKEIGKHYKDNEFDSFYYEYTHAFINGISIDLKATFNKCIDEINQSSSLDEYKKVLRVFDVIERIEIIVKQHSSLDKDSLIELNKLLFEYVNNNQIVHQFNDLELRYLKIVSDAVEILGVKGLEEYIIYCLLAQENYAKQDDCNHQQVLYSLNEIAELSLKCHILCLNKNKKANDKLLKIFVNYFETILGIVGLSNIQYQTIYLLATNSLIAGIYLKDNNLWSKISLYLDKTTNAHSISAYYYFYFVDKLDCSLEEKAKYLKEEIYYVRDTVGDEFKHYQSLFKGTFVLSINLINTKEFELALYLHESILNDISDDDNTNCFVETLQTLVCLDKRLLNKEANLKTLLQEIPQSEAGMLNYCNDLVELFGFYGDQFEDVQVKLVCYELALIVANFVLATDNVLTISYELLTDRVIAILSKAERVDKTMTKSNLSLISREYFKTMDQKMEGKAPVWYIAHRVRYAHFVYQYYFINNNFDLVYEDYGKFVSLSESLDLRENFTEFFPEFISRVIVAYLNMVGNNVNEDFLHSFVQFGLTYHYYHLYDIDLPNFGIMYGIFSRIFVRDLYTWLEFVCNPNNNQDYENNINAYFNIINEYSETKDNDISLFYCMKLIEYLNKNCSEIKEKEDIRKAYFEAYSKASVLAEELGNDDDAFQYKELAKRYQ